MRYSKYPSYKDSRVEWLGNMPSSWNIKRLKNIIRANITDGPHETPIFLDEGIPFLSVDGIQNGELTFKKSRYVSHEAHKLYSRKANVEKNDILLGKAASIGKVARVKVDFEFSIWSPLALIKPKLSVVTPSYLEYLLKSSLTQYQIQQLSTSNTQQNISMADIPKFVFSMPDIKEQQTIANYLDIAITKIVTLIEKQTKLIELLKEKRQAVISTVVTRGLDKTVAMKDSGVEWLGDIPEHWEVKKLTYLSSKIGSGKTPRGGAEVYSDEGVLFLRSQNVYDDGLALKDVVRISEKINLEMAHTQVQSGDILLNVTGASIGRTTIVPENFERANVNQHVCIIRLTSSKYKNYISLVMKSGTMKTQIEAIQNGAAREGLNFEQIAGFKLALPPQNEQEKIAKYIDEKTSKIDTLITKSTSAIELLKERRTALISAVVTGKIDVRESA